MRRIIFFIVLNLIICRSAYAVGTLPTITPPIPSISDSMDYTAGSHVGTVVATDKWKVSPANAYMLTNWDSPQGMNLVIGTFSFGEWIGPRLIGPNQWSATQLSAPQDTPSGGLVAVRVNATTDSGYEAYMISNSEFSGWDIRLYRKVNGVATEIATAWIDNTTGVDCPNGYHFDTYYQDSQLFMLEVVGTGAEVHLRLTMWVNRLVTPGGDNSNISKPTLMHLPQDILTYNGQPTYFEILSYTDTSASRILSGNPGVGWAGGQNQGGNLFGFNAGAITALPPFTLRTPSIIDTLQYPIGSRVGIDTATDKWEVNSTGMYSAATSYIQSDPTDANYPDYSAISGGPCNAVYKVPEGFSNNQWVAAQCIVPLDGAAGSYPGVRINPTTGDGYYVYNMGDTEYNYMHVWVVEKKNGSTITFPSLDVIFDGLSNEVLIDGKVLSDGFIPMLEVVGTDPVILRLSIMLPRTALRSQGHIWQDGSKYLTTLPSEVSPGDTMPYAYTVIGTYEQTGADRILTGRPGIAAGGLNPAGGIYNFNAGELPIVDGNIGAVADLDASVCYDAPIEELDAVASLEAGWCYSMPIEEIGIITDLESAINPKYSYYGNIGSISNLSSNPVGKASQTGNIGSKVSLNATSTGKAGVTGSLGTLVTLAANIELFIPTNSILLFDNPINRGIERGIGRGTL